jgi:hypothetical protein
VVNLKALQRHMFYAGLAKEMAATSSLARHVLMEQPVGEAVNDDTQWT